MFGSECKKKSWGHKFQFKQRIDGNKAGKGKEGGKAAWHQQDKKAATDEMTDINQKFLS